MYVDGNLPSKIEKKNILLHVLRVIEDFYVDS